jgi:Ca2+-binding RTX toxin-like protein
MAIVKGTNGSDLLDTRDGITSGNDAIYGYDGNDTIYAYNGDDWIRGGNGADYINGGNDIDTIDYVTSTAGVWIDLKRGEGYTGEARGDVLVSIENINGSVHDDLLIGNDEANVLVGYWGKDTLKGGGGADRLIGGEDNDTLEGGAGADFLDGGTGADILDGGVGIDVMNGGAGNDIYYVDANDIVTEFAGGGNDTVFSFAYAYTLSDNIEALSLAGSGATGTYGAGNALANAIYGNAGSNTLDGRAGADQINGMGGNDTFLFRAGEANGDVVFDFQGNGLGAGDVVYFIGYGTAAQGASIRQIDATHWEISSANGTIHDIVTFANAPTIDATDISFY